jgi:hypothetical protein
VGLDRKQTMEEILATDRKKWKEFSGRVQVHDLVIAGN